MRYPPAPLGWNGVPPGDATGSVPLAFTQEDFLVIVKYRSNLCGLFLDRD